MGKFEPKGLKPEWQMIYDGILDHCEFGEIITYGQLSAVLGREFLKHRTPIYQATKHLGEYRKRWLSTVRNIGYRVIEANEHMVEAAKHKKKAKRQLGFMIKIGDATEISKLTPEELTRFDSQRKVNAILFMVAIHHEERLRRLEKVLEREGLLTA